MPDYTDPNEIGNIMRGLQAQIDELKLRPVSYGSASEAAEEDDLEKRFRDANGVTRFIISPSDLYNELNIHAYLAALSHYGYPTAWMDADTGDNVAGGGNALMSDRGFIAKGIPFIFENVSGKYMHILFMWGFEDVEFGSAAKFFNLLIDKDTLGTNLITDGNFDAGIGGAWDVTPTGYEIVPHENGNAIQITEGYLLQYFSVSDGSLYMVTLDVYGEVSIVVQENNVGAPHVLLAYSNSFSAWTKITLVFRGEALTAGASFFLMLSKGILYGGDVWSDNDGYFNNVNIQEIADATGFVHDITSNRVYTYGDLIDRYGAVITGGGGGGGGGLAKYGDGVDGNIVLDTTPSTTFKWASKSGNTYTLLRDIYPDTLVVDSGVTLNTDGYRIFSKTSITNNGIIHNDGQDGNGVTGNYGGGGGFFLGGGIGGSGKASGEAAGAGNVPVYTVPNSLVGGLGGRGAGAWLSAITYAGALSLADGALPTPNADYGGQKAARNLFLVMQYALYPGSTPLRMLPSLGGGGGSKSAVGTSCNSGGGGGGGGAMLFASPTITNNGTISCDGGNGGNAAGTGANAGGGGGGGGGIVWLLYQTLTNGGTITANGGTGGTSVGGGTTPRKPVFKNHAISLTTVSSREWKFKAVPCKNTMYLLLVHLTVSSGADAYFLTQAEGFGGTFELVGFEAFNSIASPTRALLVFKFYSSDVEYNEDDGYVRIWSSSLHAAPTGIGVKLVEVHNVKDAVLQDASNSSDSATALTVTLPNAFEDADNAAFGVFARSGGTAGTPGAGLVEILETTAPILHAVAGYNDTTVNVTHTTAAAIAGLAFELEALDAIESGTDGLDGHVVHLQD
ncbi:MAG: hypothetical protein HY865_09650 [Chloroflexi bacterium]|nr:hypothetical protein [Chloroflexota bacterium]